MDLAGILSFPNLWDSIGKVQLLLLLCVKRKQHKTIERSYFYRSEYGHILERIMINITRYVLFGRLVN